MGASAAPCSADFDPPRRTAPAERGPRAALRPRPFPACGGGLPDHRPRVTGGGGRSRVGGHCFLALPLAVYVFSWEPSVWSGACIGGGGRGDLGTRRRHEHRKEAGSIRGGAGLPAARRPAVERARNFCPPPAGPIFREFWGFPSSSHPGAQPPAGAGWGAGWRRGAGNPVRLPPLAPPPASGRPPRPLPARGLLGNCDLNGC